VDLPRPGRRRHRREVGDDELTDPELQLLAAIAADRDDRHARRVLADLWLEGDDPVRGEALALDCDGRDASALHAAHGARWLQPAREAGYARAELTRGFVDIPLVTDRPSRELLRLCPRLYRVHALPEAGGLVVVDRVLEAALVTDPAQRFAVEIPLPYLADAGVRAPPRFDHPNVVRFVEAVELPAHVSAAPCTAWRWAGEPLALGRRYGAETTAAIARQVAAALAHVHACGAFHGELRPDHVLVDGDVATVRGFSRVAGHHAVARGYLRPRERAFCAPEQLAFGGVTSAVDVYALGAIMLAMLGDGVGGSITALANRCVARKPAERPTAAAVVEAIERAYGS
jgi:hypothetical protein